MNDEIRIAHVTDTTPARNDFLLPGRLRKTASPHIQAPLSKTRDRRLPLTLSDTVPYAAYHPADTADRQQSLICLPQSAPRWKPDFQILQETDLRPPESFPHPEQNKNPVRYINNLSAAYFPAYFLFCCICPSAL